MVELEPLYVSLAFILWLLSPVLALNFYNKFKNISKPFLFFSDLSLHKCPRNLIFQFTNLPKIEKLNLSGNELNEFNWQQLSSSKLSLIDLRNNPLNCNKCSNFWLRTRKKALSKQIINGWNIRLFFKNIF